MIVQFLSRRRMFAAFLVSTLAVAGCNRSNQLEEAVDPNALNNGGPVSSNDGGGISIEELNRQREQQELERQRSELMSNLVVYFDYDRAEIRSEFNDMLAAHGRYLAANPNVQLRLEGHSDERGSREYNIGLGERRAQAVRSVLMLQGASANQLTTVSYGEERPIAIGSNEDAWAQNRRVELVYR